MVDLGLSNYAETSGKVITWEEGGEYWTGH